MGNDSTETFYPPFFAVWLGGGVGENIGLLQTQTFPSSQISPTQWDDFILASPQGAAFLTYSYLNLVATDWQAIIVEEKGKWLAVMPFMIKKKWGFSSISQPLFCQFSGILLASTAYKTSYEALSAYKNIVTAVVENLPSADKFLLRFSPHFPYPQPFYWKGFTLKTRFTYQIELQESNENLWKNTADSLKRQIKKAQKNNLILEEVSEKKYWFDLMEENKKVGKNISGLAANGKESENILLEKTFDYWIKSKIGRFFVVKNAENQVLACGLFLFWGNAAAYFAGALQPGTENSGAMSFLMWEIIQEAKKNNYAVFDFEGSMIEGVERFFRNFGAKPVSYCEVSRNQLPKLLQWLTK